MSGRKTVLCIILLALTTASAGCAGLDGESTPAETTQATYTPNKTTTGPEPPTLNNDGVQVAMSRTQGLLGENITTQPDVVVRSYNPQNITPGEPNPFRAAWGMRPSEDIYANASGDGRYDPLSRTIYLYRAPWTDADELEYFVVHEYTHFVQDGNDIADEVNLQIPPGANPRISDYVIEGAAVFTGAVYAETYDLSYSPIERLAGMYEDAGPYRRWQLAPYYFGARYVSERVAHPNELERVYQDPPRTVEAILHGHDAAEPPTQIDVTAAPDDDWKLTGLETRGELALRLVLETGVDREAAAGAATGWDGDTVATFESREKSGYVWITHWDSTADAREFHDVAARYANQTNATGTVVLVGRSNQTVVLAAGPSTFVQNVSAVHDGDSRVRIMFHEGD